MIRPSRALVPLLLVAACATPTHEESPDSASRNPEPIDHGTVFSPLDLPTPTAERLGSGAPGPGYWQQEVDYTIDVQLDAELRHVVGMARIGYSNNSPHALDYLWLHLEQNMYRPDSVGNRTQTASLGDERPTTTGGYRISTMRSGGRELVYSEYETLARVECPEPIPPGGRFEIDLEWDFQLPLEGGRMGLYYPDAEEVFSLAQWFPCVAVYDDVTGWNGLPYLGAGEFYTNFGDYDVNITVPRGHIVAASGVLQNPDEVLTAVQRERLEQARTSAETIVVRGREEATSSSTRPTGEGPLTWRFRAENVRTFAWASSEHFIWDAADLDGTLLQSFYPPSALPLWETATQMLRHSIAGYNERWLRYPYPQASNVNGFGATSGGMEHPMIVFNGRCPNEYELYALIAHEIGHTWFPMIVNTDERRYGWQDEGLNMFINYYSIIEYCGEAGEWYDPEAFLENSLLPDQQPILTSPDQIHPDRLGFLAYDKPGKALVLLRDYVLGPDRFDRAFRDYIRRWAFKSPQPADFFRTMEDAAGADLAWFWRSWFLGTGVLDQAVVDALPRSGGDELDITFRNEGEIVMPLHYRIELEDGGAFDFELPVEIWTSTDEHVARAPLYGRQVARIVVDPRGGYPDVDRSDNVLDLSGGDAED